MKYSIFLKLAVVAILLSLGGCNATMKNHHVSEENRYMDAKIVQTVHPDGSVTTSFEGQGVEGFAAIEQAKVDINDSNNRLQETKSTNEMLGSAYEASISVTSQQVDVANGRVREIKPVKTDKSHLSKAVKNGN